MLILLFVASELLEIPLEIHRARRAVSLKIPRAVKFLKNFFPHLACISACLTKNFLEIFGNVVHCLLSLCNKTIKQ